MGRRRFRLPMRRIYPVLRPLHAPNSHEYHNGTYGRGIVGERIRGRAALQTGHAGSSPVADCAGRDRGGPRPGAQHFRAALDEIRRIPGRDATFFLEYARFFAAAIEPDLLPSIPVQIHRPRHLDTDSLGIIMMEHGNLGAAIELAMRYDDASTFPFSLANMLMERVSEQERLALLRRAIEAWREAHGDWFVPLLQFVWLFQHRWKLLPEEEARDVVREFVRVTLSEPDKPTESTYDQEGTIKITSFREHTLFQNPSYSSAFGSAIAGIAAKLASAICSSRPTLPLRHGIDQAGGRRAQEIRRREARWLVINANPDGFPYLKALMQASQDGDFEQTMEHAQQQYRSDSASEDQNLVPREFWPSTGRFRSILYAAGKRLGEDAARYLAHIDDPDLRLLAQIELAAALAGLPEFSGIQRTYRRRPTPARRQMPRPAEGPPMPGPSGETIRCPKCNWVPHNNDRWGCKCGHIWNTFETGGSCPACRYQWDVTGCLSCGELSAHSDWYVRP